MTAAGMAITIAAATIAAVFGYVWKHLQDSRTINYIMSEYEDLLTKEEAENSRLRAENKRLIDHINRAQMARIEIRGVDAKKVKEHLSSPAAAKIDSDWMAFFNDVKGPAPDGDIDFLNF